METISSRRFELGIVVITPTAKNILDSESVIQALSRHSRCDWGDVCKADREENELSLKEGFRLFSVYHDTKKEKFWIITEADRSSTTILLPCDY